MKKASIWVVIMTIAAFSWLVWTAHTAMNDRPVNEELCALYNALELYNEDFGEYPDSLSPDNLELKDATGIPYLNRIPKLEVSNWKYTTFVLKGRTVDYLIQFETDGEFWWCDPECGPVSWKNNKEK